MMKTMIRKINLKDIDKISEIENQCFDQPWAKSSLLSHLKSDGSISICAVMDGDIVGYLLAGSVLDEISIWRVCVSPNCRRMGVGEALLSSLDLEYKDASVIHLEVRVSNFSAIAMYENHGYLKVGIRPRFYEKPVEDALLMSYRKP